MVQQIGENSYGYRYVQHGATAPCMRQQQGGRGRIDGYARVSELMTKMTNVQWVRQRATGGMNR